MSGPVANLANIDVLTIKHTYQCKLNDSLLEVVILQVNFYFFAFYPFLSNHRGSLKTFEKTKFNFEYISCLPQNLLHHAKIWIPAKNLLFSCTCLVRQSMVLLTYTLTCKLPTKNCVQFKVSHIESCLDIGSADFNKSMFYLGELKWIFSIMSYELISLVYKIYS